MPPKKPPLTHFLCLPLTGGQAAPQWQASLQHFMNDIAGTDTVDSSVSTSVSTSINILKGSNIPVKAIRPLGTLHLTIGVMSLKEPERVEGAIKLLRELDVGGMLAALKVEATAEPDQNTSPPPLTLSFTSLKSMHSAKSTSFLYTAPMDTTGRLHPFCQSLKDRFTAADFMAEEERELKLHTTVLNTIYAGKGHPSKTLVQGKDGRFGIAKVDETETENADDGHESGGEHRDKELTDGASFPEAITAKPASIEPQSQSSEPKRGKKGKRRKQAVKFDARDLIKRYEDFNWARDVRIEKVAICEMGAKRITDDNGEVVGEEYTEIAAVPLP
ncbi:MAG: hypothetical protein Q9209_004862 [Squamulea sp. 1 TL-2023]